MARKVFISVLGTGNYRPCNYWWIDESKEKCTLETKYIQEATLKKINAIDWNQSKDKIIIALTDEAKKTHWNNEGENLHDILIHSGYSEEMICPIPIDKGNDEKEIENIFTAIFTKLKDDDELYFDITHGFRYLPMLVMVLINYSKFLKNTTVKSISYGVFETKTDDKPILDLTMFSELQDWTTAAAEFMETGRFGKIDTNSNLLIREIRRENAEKRNDANELDRLLRNLKEVVEDFQMCQGKKIIEGEKFGLIEEGKNINLLEPLYRIIEKVKSSFKGFQPNEYRNIFLAARWCCDKELYQQAITLLREGIICYVLNKIGEDNNEDDSRDDVINCLNKKFVPKSESQTNLLKKIQQVKLSEDFINKVGDVTLVRNYINHTGFQKRKWKNDKLANKINELVNYFLSQTKNSGNVPSSPHYPLFLNFSNHSSDKWSEEQIRAAKEFGEIQDMAFPQIDDNARSEDIQKMAKEYVKEIVTEYKDNDLTVHIMGEMTFTFEVVRLLQNEHGIRCVASCTKRIAEEKDNVRTSVFQFTQFREY
mgnify:CR=1 FL=1